MRILKSHPLLNLVNSYVIDSPQPSKIYFLWIFGVLLALYAIIRAINGVLLGITAAFFYIFSYIFIGIGLYYGSYKAPRTWTIGTIISILVKSIFLYFIVIILIFYFFPEIYISYAVKIYPNILVCHMASQDIMDISDPNGVGNRLAEFFQVVDSRDYFHIFISFGILLSSVISSDVMLASLPETSLNVLSITSILSLGEQYANYVEALLDLVRSNLSVGNLTDAQIIQAIQYLNPFLRTLRTVFWAFTHFTNFIGRNFQLYEDDTEDIMERLMVSFQDLLEILRDLEGRVGIHPDDSMVSDLP